MNTFIDTQAFNSYQFFKIESSDKWQNLVEYFKELMCDHLEHSKVIIKSITNIIIIFIIIKYS